MNCLNFTAQIFHLNCRAACWLLCAGYNTVFAQVGNVYDAV